LSLIEIVYGISLGLHLFGIVCAVLISCIFTKATTLSISKQSGLKL